jgi:signal peptidase I
MMCKNLRFTKISILFIVILIVVRMFAQHYRLSGDCMEPAFKDGSSYFVNLVLPYFRAYQAGDVVVFEHEGKNWIARIVGVEHDVLAIYEQEIMVNGVALDDRVVRNWDGWDYGTYGVNNSIQVPFGHVYVLSDNLSAHHDDSRVFGPIAKSLISGIVW